MAFLKVHLLTPKSRVDIFRRTLVFRRQAAASLQLGRL